MDGGDNDDGTNEYMLDESGSPGEIYNIIIDYQLDGKFIINVNGTEVTSGTITDPSILTNYYLEFHMDEYYPTSPLNSEYTLDEIKVDDITFKCGLAQTNTGYDVSSCDVSNGNITEQQCAVTCGTGYSGEARARCNTYNGSFAFTGCQ